MKWGICVRVMDIDHICSFVCSHIVEAATTLQKSMSNKVNLDPALTLCLWRLPKALSQWPLISFHHFIIQTVHLSSFWARVIYSLTSTPYHLLRARNTLLLPTRYRSTHHIEDQKVWICHIFIFIKIIKLITLQTDICDVYKALDMCVHSLDSFSDQLFMNKTAQLNMPRNGDIFHWRSIGAQPVQNAQGHVG